MLELRPDQIEDLTKLIANPRFMLLNDPGTGKTPTVCVYLYYLWSKRGVKSFWSMPKSLMKKNRMELLRWSRFKPEEVQIINGTKEQRDRQMRNADAKVFIMTFKRFAESWETMLTLHPELNCHAIDEWHFGFSGHEAQRTQSLYRAMQRIKYFLPMTGSIIRGGRLDAAYPAIHIIEPRYYFSYEDFYAYHAEFDLYGEFAGWRNHERLAKIIDRHSSRRTFESIFGKQEEVVQLEEVEMSPKQRKAYDEFHAQAMLELEDAFIDGENPGVAVIRARQIMAHPEAVPNPKYDALLKLVESKVEPPDVLKGVPKTVNVAPGEVTGKDEALICHLEDHKASGEPLLIYAAFVPEVERIAKLCRKHGFRVGVIHGGFSLNERNRVDQDFQDGKLDIVVATPATAAVGYNWSHVNHIIFVSLDYMNDDYEQAKRRAIRGKRTKPLRITILLYENSLDYRTIEIVDRKSRDANKVDSTYEELALATKPRVSRSEKYKIDENDPNRFTLAGF